MPEATDAWQNIGVQGTSVLLLVGAIRQDHKNTQKSPDTPGSPEGNTEGPGINQVLARDDSPAANIISMHVVGEGPGAIP